MLAAWCIVSEVTQQHCFSFHFNRNYSIGCKDYLIVVAVVSIENESIHYRCKICPLDLVAIESHLNHLAAILSVSE